MQIIQADAMGICFGVRDAIEQSRSIAAPHEVTIHGELAHNERLLVQLQQRGFVMSDEQHRDDIPATPQVMITAHGISQRERRRLVHAGKQLIDTTCPLVARVHETAAKLAAGGYLVIVLGKPDHVEVRGIVEDLERYEVIPGVESVRRFDAERLGIICQTTLPTCRAEQIRQAIVKHNPQAEIRFVDTICQPTKDRQAAVRRLVEQVQAVVVVGGRHSNNTARLADYCRERGRATFHIQSAADLQADWFTAFDTVGLTAGTSTLPETIAAVRARLEEIGRGREEQSVVQSTPPSASAAWREYFERNARNLIDIPWKRGAELTEAERRTIRRSIQEFQLGESGRGRHFLRCAALYAEKTGDADYVAALELFLAEEHRHARTLGQFMDSAGIPRIEKAAANVVFRRLRHAAGLDLIISVLVTAEIIAKVYYRGLRDATSSTVLRTLCTQILRDEVAHVRFQSQQLGELRRDWRRWRHAVANVGQRILLAGSLLVVWKNHRRVLRSGGFGFRRYWRTSWKEFRAALRLMRPDRRSRPIPAAHCARLAIPRTRR